MYSDTNLATFPLATLPSKKEPRRYTLAEYLKREERSEELHEYENGIITKLPMAKGPHNEIVGNITTSLKIAIKSHGKKYRVFTGQQLIYLPKLNISRYPDVLTVAETPQYFDQNEVLLTNPIVIVEVLSNGTKAYDRTGKFHEYQTSDTFQEYVLINQDECLVEVRYRDQPNVWISTFYKNLDESIHLKSLDLHLALTDIYENIVLKR
jgi:Uma2 family endonuclease